MLSNRRIILIDRLFKKEIHISSFALNLLFLMFFLVPKYAFSQHEKLKIKLTTNEKFYMASNNSIIKIINGIDEKFSNILIVAHNPGLTNLINEISDSQLENLPTAGAIAFSFDGRWIDFGKMKCKFLFYEFPKKYK